MKLVENIAGTGELFESDRLVGHATYHIRRYQGMSPGSGLPIPGFFRIEGQVVAAGLSGLVGKDLGLRLEDGRLLAITLSDETGRVLSEGHGPSKCGCC